MVIRARERCGIANASIAPIRRAISPGLSRFHLSHE
jgi:hypothetical protein